MPYASEGTYRACLSLHATHSNHPVTLLSPHLYFQTEDGSLFPLKRRLGCVMMTCDPLLTTGDLMPALAEFDEAGPILSRVYYLTTLLNAATD